jgi:hypothetical protein
LFLLVALIPSVVIKILPTYGVSIDSPALTAPSTSRHLEFTATDVLKSTATNAHYEFIWKVYRSDIQSNFPLRQERHTDDDTKTDSAGYLYTYFDRTDAITVKDYYSCDFTPGEYDVVVYVFKLGPNDNTIE